MIYRRIVGWLATAASGWFLLTAAQNWFNYFCSRSDAATSGFFDSIANAIASEMYYRKALEDTKWFVMVTALSVLCEIAVKFFTNASHSQTVLEDGFEEVKPDGRAKSRGTGMDVAVPVIFAIMVLVLIAISVISISRDGFSLHISSRRGVLSDNVLIVSNESSTVSQKVKVEFDYADGNSKSEKVFDLEPNAAKELGAIQLLRRPKQGDAGCVSRISERGDVLDSVRFELGPNGGCRILK